LAIKKAKVKHYTSDTNFDVLHYETQVSQVKVLDANGVVTSNLDEILFKGKLLDGVNLNTVKESGFYRIKNCSNMPSGLPSTETYMLEVKAIDNGKGVVIVQQRLYNHLTHDTFTRTIEGSTIGSWLDIGQNMQTQIGSLQIDLMTLENNIDAVDAKADNNTQSIVQLQTEINDLENQLNTHNHNSVYLRLSGGNLTGDTSVANNKSFAGKNTSGTNLNIGKVNGNNEVVLGDTGAKAVIQASSDDVKVFNGTNSYKVFHEGNMGSGSGLNADQVDGIEGSSLARRDTTNYFTQDQFVDSGKSLALKAPAGSSQAGSIYWRDGNGNQKGRILVGIDGDFSIFAGTINGHTFKSDGTLFSTYSHVLDATSREVHVRFRKDSGDTGIGLYLNSNNNELGIYDWENSNHIFTVDRPSATLQVTNAIQIQGHKLYIQSSAPSNPSVGDIWFDI
jgi:hypothetical protein